MTRPLPVLTKTLKQTFRLYGRTFIDVLPFVLLLTLGNLGLNHYFGDEAEIGVLAILKALSELLLLSFFYCFVLFGMYQKHTTQIFDFWQVLLQFKRIFPLWLASILVSLPVILVLGLIALPYYIAFLDNLKNLIQPSQIITGLIALSSLIVMIISVYCFIAGLNIVIKQQTAILALKNSWSGIRGHWWAVFSGIVAILLIEIIARLTFSYLGINYADLIIYAFTASLYPALMVIRFCQLENV